MPKRDSSSDTPNSTLSDTPPGTSKAQQLKEQVKDQARSLADQAKDSTSELAGEARDRVQGLVSEQKGRVADQLGSLAGALREAGGKLDEQHTEGLSLGRYAGQAADRVDSLSRYLRERDLGDVVRDAEGFARRRPELFLGGTFLAGLLLARFLKASSDRPDVQDSNWNQDWQNDDWRTRSTASSSFGAGQGYPQTGQGWSGGAGAGSMGTAGGLGTTGGAADRGDVTSRPYTPPAEG